MGITIKTNTNGSITVSCGTDTMTFFPGSTGDADSVSTGGAGGVPVVIDDDDPVVGWPLPGAGLVANQPSVHFDPLRGEFVWAGTARRDFLRSIASRSGYQPMPLRVFVPAGQSFELGRMTRSLDALRTELNCPIVPLLLPDIDL